MKISIGCIGIKLIFGFISVASFVYSQPSESHSWWVNMGAGPSLIGSSFSMNAGLVYCNQLDNSIISARIIGVTNKNPTVQKIDRTAIEYKFSDYGILYGPMWKFRKAYLSVGCGIGLVRAAYEMQESISTNSSVSIPFETQLFWRPTNFAGIGLYGYASLNLEKNLYGALVSVQLGIW